MRDIDPEKRRGRWTLYLFSAAVALSAGHGLLAGFDGAAPYAGNPRPFLPPIAALSVQSAAVELRAIETPRYEEYWAGPAAAAAATPRPSSAPPESVVEAAAPPSPAAAAPAPLRASRPQINLRAGPGTQFGVLGRVGPDAVLTPTGRNDGEWVEITTGPQADFRGWVSRPLTEERR